MKTNWFTVSFSERSTCPRIQYYYIVFIYISSIFQSPIASSEHNRERNVLKTTLCYTTFIQSRKGIAVTDQMKVKLYICDVPRNSCTMLSSCLPTFVLGSTNRTNCKLYINRIGAVTWSLPSIILTITGYIEIILLKHQDYM